METSHTITGFVEEEPASSRGSGSPRIAKANRKQVDLRASTHGDRIRLRRLPRWLDCATDSLRQERQGASRPAPVSPSAPLLEPKQRTLLCPYKRQIDLLDEPVRGEINELPPGEDARDDVGRQDGKRQAVGDGAPGHAFIVGDLREGPSASRCETIEPIVCSQYGLCERRSATGMGR